MTGLADVAEQLGLEDELALLVLLARLVGLVVLPSDRLLALLARDVAHDVAPRRHAALRRLARVDVDDRVEQVGLAMLTAEVLFSVEATRAHVSKVALQRRGDRKARDGKGLRSRIWRGVRCSLKLRIQYRK